jgi:hypothetical protein
VFHDFSELNMASYQDFGMRPNAKIVNPVGDKHIQLFIFCQWLLVGSIPSADVAIDAWNLILVSRQQLCG